MGKKFRVLLSLATAFSGYAAPVWATEAANAAQQVTPQDSTSSTGDIVVTARRREEAASKVPIAITAFDDKALQNKQVTNIRDLTSLTPGLNFVGGGAATSLDVSIRGYSRPLAGPGVSGVISYFNDVPLQTFAANVPAFDLANVQVLKGPQGTLFGRNAIGGAISINSKMPTYDFGGYIQGEYGSFNTGVVEGAINIPIVADKVALRVAAQLSSSDGYTKGIRFSPQTGGRPAVAIDSQPINLDQSTGRYFRATLLVEPVKGVSNVTVVDYNHSTGIGGISVAYVSNAGLLGFFYGCGTSPSCDVTLALNQALSHPRVQYINVPPASETNWFGVSNKTTINLTDDIAFKNIFGYRTFHQDSTTDLSGTALPISDTRSEANTKQVTDEIQLTGTALHNTINFITGAFYVHTSPNGLAGDQGLYESFLSGASADMSANYEYTTSKALYAQLDYDASALVHGLKFTGGLRYTWDKVYGCIYGANYSSAPNPPLIGSLPFMPDVAQCQSGNFTPDPSALPGRTASANLNTSSHKLTYTFAADWQVTDGLLLYATTRRGYRTGGYNAPEYSPQAASVQFFKPETLTDIEIGAKGHFTIGSIPARFSIDAFRGKDKDSQTYITIANVAPLILPGSTLLANNANYTIKGVEGDFNVGSSKGLSAGGSFAYFGSNLDKYTTPAFLIPLFAAAGDSLSLKNFGVSNQPKWQLNGNAQYVFPSAIGGADLVLGGDVHYQDQYHQGTINIPDYTVANARIALQGLANGKLDVTAWVKNLANKFYYYGGSLSTPSLGLVTLLDAAPRSFGFTARYRFGE